MRLEMALSVVLLNEYCIFVISNLLQAMDIFSIIVLAFALAMDCFAVSLMCGLVSKRFLLGRTLCLSFSFAFFQGAMPLLGFCLGKQFADAMNAVSHWVAFVLLLIVGLKMIFESMKETESSNFDFSVLGVLILSLATSLDALATGIIFVVYPASLLLLAVSCFALVALLLSVVGNVVGVYFRKRIGVNVELIGGVLLILIGVKILVERLCF